MKPDVSKAGSDLYGYLIEKYLFVKTETKSVPVRNNAAKNVSQKFIFCQYFWVS